MANPILNFFTTAGSTIGLVDFGTIASGQQSDILEIELWNNKGGTIAVDTARNVAVTVRNSTAPAGEDPVENGWVRARSSGIQNPSNQADFIDDNQGAFTKIDLNTNLEIGDIPNNSGRTIFAKLDIPFEASAQNESRFRIIAGFRPPSNPLPFFFNRAFGDGLVDEKVPQIFPAILKEKNGTWTDLVVSTSGLYTGNRAKQYCVSIAGGCFAGLVVGVATYSTSDNGGVTFGPALTTSTTQATNILTSAGVDEGVNIRWSSLLAATLVHGDAWTVNVDINPFGMIPGVSTSLEGVVGFGEALVANNRVRHQSVSVITGLTANNKNYVFIDADGTFDVSLNGNPVVGKLKLGHFETDSQKVISATQFALPVTLGTDAFDDFGPNFQELEGLTFTYFRGKYRRFNEIVRIPALTSFPCGTISLFPNATNYLQIRPVEEQIVALTTGYAFDYIPLFQVVTGGSFMEDIQDDRTNIGVTSLNRSLVATISNITAGLSFAFNFPDFAARAIVKKTVFTPNPSITGYTITIFGKSDLSVASKQYQAGTLSSVFTDSFTWFFSNTDGVPGAESRVLYGTVENLNVGGLTIDLGLEILYEQLH